MFFKKKKTNTQISFQKKVSYFWGATEKKNNYFLQGLFRLFFVGYNHIFVQMDWLLGTLNNKTKKIDPNYDSFLDQLYEKNVRDLSEPCYLMIESPNNKYLLMGSSETEILRALYELHVRTGGIKRDLLQTYWQEIYDNRISYEEQVKMIFSFLREENHIFDAMHTAGTC